MINRLLQFWPSTRLPAWLASCTSKSWAGVRAAPRVLGLSVSWVSAAGRSLIGRRPRLSALWTLPPLYRPIEEMTTAEVARESRESRPLHRAMGWRDSAILNPSASKHQYLRTMQYTGDIPMRPSLWMAGTSLGGAAAFIVLFAFFGSGGGDESNLYQNAYINMLIGGMIGGLIASSLGWGVKSVMQFRSSHADCIAIEASDEDGGWKYDALLLGKIPRLSQIDKDATKIFTGPPEHSGFRSGQVFLRTAPDQRIREVTSMRDLFQMVSTFGRFIGNNATATYNLFHGSMRTGGLRQERMKKKQWQDVVTGNIGVAFGIVAIIGAVFMFAGDFGTPAEAPQVVVAAAEAQAE